MDQELIKLVSLRINKCLNNYPKFNLSSQSLKDLHSYLFADIFPFAGEFRKDNLFKKEWVLDDATVFYVNYQDILSYLEYDLQEEKKYHYEDKGQDDIIKHIAKLTSNIWQVHPFSDGNTRCVGVFLLLYLQKLGYEINKDVFKDNFSYFRNALVLSNAKDKRNLPPLDYLIKFYENLILKKDNILDEEELLEDNRERRNR